MMHEAERLSLEPCGCRVDIPTGIATFFCAAHDPARIPDLEIPCDDCGGLGVVQHPAWAAWSQAFDAARERADHMGIPDVLGYATREAGAQPLTDAEEVPCSSCGGRGTHPTKTGRQVLEFVRRHA